jgi:hypothetical protein
MAPGPPVDNRSLFTQWAAAGSLLQAVRVFVLYQYNKNWGGNTASDGIPNLVYIAGAKVRAKVHNCAGVAWLLHGDMASSAFNLVLSSN